MTFLAVDISIAVKSIFKDSGPREPMVKRGLERAQGFTWDKGVRETPKWPY